MNFEARHEGRHQIMGKRAWRHLTTQRNGNRRCFGLADENGQHSMRQVVLAQQHQRSAGRGLDMQPDEIYCYCPHTQE